MVTQEELGTKKYLKEWGENVERYHQEANFLQSPLWYYTNQKIGHEVKVFSINTGTQNDENYAFYIIKNAKRGRYMEVPGGPLIDWSNTELVKAMFDALKRQAVAYKCGFIRVRPQLENTPENLKLLKQVGLKLSPMHLHAEHTVIIDLNQSESALLAAMRRQTRYEVRRAEKLGLKVTSISADHKGFQAYLDEFYDCQQQTAARQHFISPTKKELEAECSAFGKNATLYKVETAENQPVAYGLILKWGEEADYYEAASTDLNRKLPGAYALLWAAMKDLKREGFSRFNLWGIAPKGQKNHRYAGVTTFKTGFGGKIVNFAPAHDLIISKLRYIPDYFVETARRHHRHLG